MESSDSNYLQREFWKGEFGQNYILRNQTLKQINELYKKQTGITVQSIFEDFFESFERSLNILELGCNIGINFTILKNMGFRNLTGVELNPQAISFAKQNHPELEFINSSIEDFNSSGEQFDLVYTAGVLIHIHPNSLLNITDKITSLSKKFVFGFEYFSEKLEEISYRNNTMTCWKQNFPNLYIENQPTLKLIKISKFPYLENNILDIAYLLEKK